MVIFIADNEKTILLTEDDCLTNNIDYLIDEKNIIEEAISRLTSQKKCIITKDYCFEKQSK